MLGLCSSDSVFVSASRDSEIEYLVLLNLCLCLFLGERKINEGHYKSI